MQISPRYPIVEAITGLVFVAVGLAFAPAILNAEAASSSPPRSSPSARTSISRRSASCSRSSTSTCTGCRTRSCYPAYVVGAVLLTAAALLAGEPARLVQAALGGGTLFLFYFVLALVYPAAWGSAT